MKRFSKVFETLSSKEINVSDFISDISNHDRDFEDWKYHEGVEVALEETIFGTYYKVPNDLSYEKIDFIKDNGTSNLILKRKSDNKYFELSIGDNGVLSDVMVEVEPKEVTITKWVKK